MLFPGLLPPPCGAQRVFDEPHTGNGKWHPHADLF